MDLTIYERFMLASIMPLKDDDISLLKIARDFKYALAFSEEETEEHNIRPSEKCPTCGAESGGHVWNPESSEYVKDISIGPRAMSLIVSRFEKLNSEKKLTVSYIGLYDRFMEDN